MNINEVIHHTIVALYSEPDLSSVLFLKGGTAVRVFEGNLARLSLDIDFSVERSIDNEPQFFGLMKKTIGAKFRKHGHDVIDFKWNRRPKIESKDRPEWWGGWACQFKLVGFSHRGKSLETKRRNALKPEGSNSPMLLIEISEHEYCKAGRKKKIDGVTVLGYSRELIVLEKIRAICQQHPEYAHTISRNRARDFYDIYHLTQDADPQFISACRKHIANVFEAKEVPITILSRLWEKDFIDEQERGFDQVRDTVSGPIRTFSVYVEHLRFLIREICP